MTRIVGFGLREQENEVLLLRPPATATASSGRALVDPLKLIQPKAE